MTSYKDSGVDIELGNTCSDSAIDVMKTQNNMHLKLWNEKVPMYDLGSRNMFMATDGVGTKLWYAEQYGDYSNIGIDLVAMVVNDLYRYSAIPIGFTNYIGMPRLVSSVHSEIIDSIMRGCDIANCSLMGGETAENVPFELVGTAVGFAKKHDYRDYHNIRPGHVIMGIPSNGLHSNGFSLLRKLENEARYRIQSIELLKPTRIYTEVVRVAPLCDAIIHVTGGGFYGKLSSILSDLDLSAKIDTHSWEMPQCFRDIVNHIDQGEAWMTFNMGIGMMLIVPPERVPYIKRLTPDAREIGSVISSDTSFNVVYLI